MLQFDGEAASRVEYVPTPQSRQVEEEEAPIAVEYCPARYGMPGPVVAPSAVVYRPAPTWLQLAAEGAPSCDEYVPAAQSEQLAEEGAPGSVAYRPATHRVQLPESTAPCSDAYEPAAHAVHVLDVTAPDAVE